MNKQRKCLLLIAGIVSLLTLTVGNVSAFQTPQVCTVYNSASAYSSDGSAYVVASPSFNTCTNVAGGSSGFSATQPNGHYLHTGSSTICGNTYTITKAFDWMAGQMQTGTQCKTFEYINITLGYSFSHSFPSTSGSYSQITTYGWSGNCGTWGSGACWATVTASAPLP